MDDSTTHYHIGDQAKELVIRHGDALDPQTTAKKSISISGILKAPFQFLEGKPWVKDEDSHLKIQADKGILTLVVNDTDPYTTHTITGSLTRNNVLGQFLINHETKRWTNRQLHALFRLYRYVFTNPEIHAKLLTSLLKWEVSVASVFKDIGDNSGNSLLLIEKKVSEIDLVRDFNLTLPIFQGYPKVTFKVQIGFEARSNGVELYLFSDELFEIEATLRESIIEEEVKQFDKRKFSKIQIS